MSDTIDALDNLSMAKHLFFAALMALADIDDMQERSAIEAVLSEGLAKLKAGVATLETIRANGENSQTAPSHAGQLGTLITVHVKALAAYDAEPGDNPKSPAVARANALVTKTRQALFDHRPTNMAEAARKGEFMASCRTFIEWDDFDQVQLINALTPMAG